MERLAASSAARAGATRSRAALAEETGLSFPALEQVLHFLEIAGLLRAGRGTSGGVRLAQPAPRISLLQVVRAIDGAGLWGRCILGFEECSDEIPCPAHPAWKTTRAVLEAHLDGQSIADLARTLKRRRLTGSPPRPQFAIVPAARPSPGAVALDVTGDR